jgi:hypothetical protein
MVSARGQVDVLDVSGRLTIKNSADENTHGFIKASFVVLGFDDGGLVREVVSHDLVPGSFGLLVWSTYPKKYVCCFSSCRGILIDKNMHKIMLSLSSE